MKSAIDFGISPESDWMEPDNLVALHEFRKHIVFEMAEMSVERNEMLPVQMLVDKIKAELDLDREQYSAFAYAGMMIEYDRMVRSETPEERAEREERSAKLAKLLDEATEEFGGFDEFVRAVHDEQREQKTEIDALNELFGFTDDED